MNHVPTLVSVIINLLPRSLLFFLFFLFFSLFQFFYIFSPFQSPAFPFNRDNNFQFNGSFSLFVCCIRCHSCCRCRRHSRCCCCCCHCRRHSRCCFCCHCCCRWYCCLKCRCSTSKNLPKNLFATTLQSSSSNNNNSSECCPNTFSQRKRGKRMSQMNKYVDPLKTFTKSLKWQMARKMCLCFDSLSFFHVLWIVLFKSLLPSKMVTIEPLKTFQLLVNGSILVGKVK